MKLLNFNPSSALARTLALPIAALSFTVGSASAAVVAQQSNNSSVFNAQVLNTAFSSGFVAEIEGSDNLNALHATVQGGGIADPMGGAPQQAWYFFTHIGGDLFIDIDNSTLMGEGPTPNLMIGLFNAIGMLVAVSDSTPFSDPDAGSTNLHDPFIGITNADSMNYYVAVLASGGSFADGFVATGDGAPIDSAYDLHVTVPEPSAALLGLLGAGLMLRRKRA